MLSISTGTMDSWNELESMAEVARRQPDDLEDYEPSKHEIKRWRKLFGYTRSEAIDHIRKQKFTRLFGGVSVSDLHWEEVREEKELQGHDRDTYEHSCSVLAQSSNASRTSPAFGFPISSASSTRKQTEALDQTYLVKLDGPFLNAETVQLAAGLSILPPTYTGSNVDNCGEIQTFCKIDGVAKDKLLAWLCHSTSTPVGWKPTVVKNLAANKALSTISPYPTLGIDPTMPQNRLDSCDTHDPKLVPAQNDYPVWYFFYGTLADSTILKRVLGTDNEPVFHPARARGGRLTTWGDGKYNALVDFASWPQGEKSTVKGYGYLVKDREGEDALRYYETNQFEVVRCLMEMDEGGGVKMVRGLTFRFKG